jgi:general secretion pathway protein M
VTSGAKYWASLSSRERLLIVSGSTGVIAIVLYALVWAPMHDSILRLRGQVQSQTQDLAWMHQQASVIAARSGEAGKVKPGTGRPLLTVIDQAAKAIKVRDAIKQIQPGNEAETAKVWFDKIIFEDWLKWLERISSQGIVVSRVSITRSAEAPRVTIRMELLREPPSSR